MDAPHGKKHTDFSDWIDVFVTPSIGGVHIAKPVTIITNRYSYSATEWFVLLAATLPHVKILGDTTGGGSAIPLIRELPNGWLLRISNTQIMTPSGDDFQFKGLYPDVPVWITSSDAEKGIDTILEKAMLK